MSAGETYKSNEVQALNAAAKLVCTAWPHTGILEMARLIQNLRDNLIITKDKGNGRPAQITESMVCEYNSSGC